MIKPIAVIVLVILAGFSNVASAQVDNNNGPCDVQASAQALTVNSGGAVTNELFNSANLPAAFKGTVGFGVFTPLTCTPSLFLLEGIRTDGTAVIAAVGFRANKGWQVVYDTAKGSGHPFAGGTGGVSLIRATSLVSQGNRILLIGNFLVGTQTSTRVYDVSNFDDPILVIDFGPGQ